MPGKGRGVFGRNLFEDSLAEQKRNLNEIQQQLAVVVGTKKVLAVRVIHDGTTSTAALTSLQPSYTKVVLADDVFGSAIGG